ncbi:MAG TPA: sigma-70 family RNA polymerase sigma factor [Puia sp.]|nr:sigma-70 family RNA polymerase sigma factor [Puia sp.]
MIIDQTTAISNRASDEHLITRILSGEKQDFEVIIRRYNQRLFRVGMSVLGNEGEVEEAMQAAYLSAYEHLHQFEFRAAFGTWLTRIMLNQCFKARRSQIRSSPLTADSENVINMKTPENVMCSKELNQVLENAIARLPEKYRLIFVLREIEELSVKEAAEVAGIQESNVKVRLNRAKSMLRQSLNHYMRDSVYPFHLSRCNEIAASVMGKILPA